MYHVIETSSGTESVTLRRGKKFRWCRGLLGNEVPHQYDHSICLTKRENKNRTNVLNSVTIRYISSVRHCITNRSGRGMIIKLQVMTALEIE